MMARTLVLFAGLVAWIATAFSQTPTPGLPQPPPSLISFEGVVTDANGRGVRDAEVSGRRAQEIEGASTRTSDDGRYQIVPRSSEGTYTIQAVLGKDSVTKQVIVPLPPPSVDRPIRFRAFVENLAFGGGKAVTGWAEIPIYYATDRLRQVAGGRPVFGSAADPADRFSYGVSTVRVPRRHQMGQLERPDFWKLFVEDENQHIVIAGGADLLRDRFFAGTRRTSGPPYLRRVLVFVHGFNVTFDEALHQSAQLVYDIGFDGIPILYSWPSGSSPLPNVYAGARVRLDQGREDEYLRQFLTELARGTDGSHIYLLAHSLGTDVLTRALALMKTRPSRTGIAPVFAQTLLAAPDISQKSFAIDAPYFSAMSRRTTSYASRRDLALTISELLLSGYSRAGQTSPPKDLTDSVDASLLQTGFVSHSYFASHKSIISDILILTCRNDPPVARGLRQVQTPTGAFWIAEPIPVAIPKECIVH
jgi:esterase/lipase superfamily enzyme